MTWNFQLKMCLDECSLLEDPVAREECKRDCYVLYGDNDGEGSGGVSSETM